MRDMCFGIGGPEVLLGIGGLIRIMAADWLEPYGGIPSMLTNQRAYFL